MRSLVRGNWLLSVPAPITPQNSLSVQLNQTLLNEWLMQWREVQSIQTRRSFMLSFKTFKTSPDWMDMSSLEKPQY